MAETSPKSPKRRQIRVALVDEFPIFSEALGVVIGTRTRLRFRRRRIDVVGGRRSVTRLAVDVAVIDIDVPTPGSPEFDGIDAIKQIKAAQPQTRVLILAGLMNVDTMARAASEGACGFLPKTSTLEDICRAIRTAKDGGMFVERELVGQLIDRLQRGRPIEGGSARADITPREQEVLTLLGEGLDATAIAKRLGITINTCRGHVKNLLTKFGAHSQLEAVVEAVHQGLLPHLSR